MGNIFFIAILILLFSLGVNSRLNSHEIQFSTVEEESMEAFEKEIAYFFGAYNQEPIVKAYISALKKLEEVGSNASINILEQEIVPYLEDAYKEIAQQRHWNFDIHEAAITELQIILGNANGSSFENIQNFMAKLYTLVFQSHSPNIRKAAMLRTFLYQYKVNVLKTEQKISEQDRELMIKMAKTSEKLLNSIK